METVAQLRVLAKKAGIKGFSKMVKAELQAALAGVKAVSTPASCQAEAVPAELLLASANPCRDAVYLYELNNAQAHVVLLDDVPDLNKLKHQCRLSSREREPEYLDTILAKVAFRSVDAIPFEVSVSNFRIVLIQPIAP